MLKKQIGLLIGVFFLFFCVWGLVFFQVIGKQSEVKSEPPVEKAELDEFVLLNKEDDFEETVIEIDNISDKGVDYSERQDQLINLADYDFSDISSADGIPVEGILEKIGLGN